MTMLMGVVLYHGSGKCLLLDFPKQVMQVFLMKPQLPELLKKKVAQKSGALAFKILNRF